MLSITLLGPPSVHRAGAPVAGPKGSKAWALLAYLLLSETAPSRQLLADLFVPDASDPAGALRWNLSQLRKALGVDVAIDGDPVRVTLPAAASVDATLVANGSWAQIRELPGLGRPLLEGLRFDGSPGAELWLTTERRRLTGRTEDLLHDAVLRAAGRGDVDEALLRAEQLAALSPLDENAQLAHVRALRAVGETERAAKEVEAITQRFHRELGVEPSHALRRALEEPTVSASPVVSAATVRAQIDAGEAAVNAGAHEAGLQSLRAGVAGARSLGDDALAVRALTAIGSALVHSARGNDEEGAAALHEAEQRAMHSGLHDRAAFARREIAYVSVLRSRYDAALGWLDSAREIVPDDPAELAWIGVVEGLARTDLGTYAVAERVLHAAVADARRGGDRKAEAFARSNIGRIHLLRGELDEADAELGAAVELVRSLDWTGFLPWPEALSGEVALLQGDVTTAAERIEHAFALGCSVADPCWESLGVRGLGLVAEARGEIDRAIELLEEAPRRCRRLPDAYLWVEAYAYDALCDVATRHDVAGAGRWIERMDALVAPRGIRELASNAALYRARLGEPGAAEVARSLAADVDNPALHARVAAIS